MKNRIKIAFKTPFYEPCYAEFYNPLVFTEFLHHLDFMESHVATHLTVAMPEIRLGLRTVVHSDGNEYLSKVSWVTRLLVGRDVLLNFLDTNLYERQGYATVPMDSPLHMENGDVARQWQEIVVNTSKYSAVIDNATMKQLWPHCRKDKTEFARFMTEFARAQSKIKHR